MPARGAARALVGCDVACVWCGGGAPGISRRELGERGAWLFCTWCIGTWVVLFMMTMMMTMMMMVMMTMVRWRAVDVVVWAGLRAESACL